MTAREQVHAQLGRDVGGDVADALFRDEDQRVLHDDRADRMIASSRPSVGVMPTLASTS